MNPITTRQEIETQLQNYIRRTLPVERSVPAFTTPLDDMFKKHTLTQDPYLEIMPGYESGASLQDLVDEQVIHQETANIFAQAFDRETPARVTLYSHQADAIRAVCRDDRNLVVCSGTGSGKTECFLIPLINYLVGEWVEEGRPEAWNASGVRALILYPMNALVNDQIRRLRTILRVCDGSTPGIPRITFGMYTGELVPIGDEESLRQQLKDHVEEHRQAIGAATQGTPWTGAGFDDEAPLENEVTRRSVWHDRPAHILVSNYSMLERLLLQPETSKLFKKPWKYIILDEAHCYDGALGTEIAWLVRRLKQRIGNPDHLRFMATSATLIDDPHLTVDRRAQEIRTKFASQLFPAQPETFNVQFGTPLQFVQVPDAYVAPQALDPGAYSTLVDTQLSDTRIDNLLACFEDVPGMQQSLQSPEPLLLFRATQIIMGAETWNRRLEKAVSLASQAAQPMAVGDALYLARLICDANESKLLPITNAHANAAAIEAGMLAGPQSMAGLQALVRFVEAGVGSLNDNDKWRERLHDYGDPRPSSIPNDTYQLENGVEHQQRYGNRLHFREQWTAILGNDLTQLTVEGLTCLLKTAEALATVVEDEKGVTMPAPLSVNVAFSQAAQAAVAAFSAQRNVLTVALQNARRLLTEAWREHLADLAGTQPRDEDIGSMVAWFLGNDATLALLSEHLRTAMADAENKADQARYEVVARVLFPGFPDPCDTLDALISLATMGLHPLTRRPLLDIRYHQLVRGMREVGISFGADTNSFSLHPSDALTQGEGDACRAVFTLGVCRNCGQPYALGYAKVATLNAGAGMQSLSRIKTEQLQYLHAIAWQQGATFEDAEPDFPRDNDDNVWLNTRTGQAAVGVPRPEPHADWIQGRWYVKPVFENGDFLKQCPCCGDTHDRPADNQYGVITPYKAYGEHLKLVLLDELVRWTDPSVDPAARRHPGEGRKLLAFSDSRRGAASLAYKYQELSSTTTISRLIPEGVALLNDNPPKQSAQEYIREKVLIGPLQQHLNKPEFAAVAQSLVAAEAALAGVIGVSAGFRVRIEETNAGRLLEVSDKAGADMDETEAAKLRLLQALRRKGRYSLLRRGVLRLESKSLQAARANNQAWNNLVNQFGGRIDADRLYALCNEILLYLFERATMTIGNNWQEEDLNHWPKHKLVTYGAVNGCIRFVSDHQSHVFNRLVRDALHLPNNVAARNQASDVLEVLWPIFTAAHGDSRVLRDAGNQRYNFNHDDIVLKIGEVQAGAGNPTRADAYDIYLATRDIVPVRIEEHTAQLAKERAAAYQKAFADGSINILSCSTTFEMGVDLGDLTCVFLSNLPPAVSNYRQRAGRAGRRPGSAAYVVSFVGETQHEQYYFDRPAQLLFGRVRMPSIYLDNPIFRARHLRAEALHDFLTWMAAKWEIPGTKWQNKAPNRSEPVRRNWSLIGHFFVGRLAAAWNGNGGWAGRITTTFIPIVDQLAAWHGAREADLCEYVACIADVPQPLGYSVATDLVWQLQTQDMNQPTAPYLLTADNLPKYATLGGPNQPDVDGGGALAVSSNVSQREVRGRIRALYDGIGLPGNPDKTSSNPPGTPSKQQVHLLNEQTITWLTRNRVLPKYGFPVDVVRLLPDDNDPHGRNVEMERDRRIGLYEYAPGQVVMADKRVYPAERVEVFLPGGVNKAEAAKRWFHLCSSCHQPHEVTAPLPRCSSCGGELNPHPRTVIQPDAFRAGLSRAGNAGVPLERGTPLKIFTGGIKDQITASGMSMATAESDTGELLYLNNGSRYQGFPHIIDGENVSLFHRVKTDIAVWLPDAALFSGNGALAALGLNTVRLKAAMQSALEAILRAASIELQIADREIGGITYPYNAAQIGFVLFDESSGGGGAVLPLVLTGNPSLDASRTATIRGIVEKAIELCESCPECERVVPLATMNLTLPPVSRETWLAEPNEQAHRRQQSSCYKCLRSYGNQRFHHLLDRGDAVVVLKALLTPRSPYVATEDDRQFIRVLGECAGGAKIGTPDAGAALPPIEVSEDPPPLFRRYPRLEAEYRQMYHDEPLPEEGRQDESRPETFDIEELLGCYHSSPSRIVLYAIGIRWFARCLNVDEDVLRSVVLVHELGHWITHLLPPGEWPRADFNASETDVKEGWAQLLTHWVGSDTHDAHPEFKAAFDALNRRQSPSYHVYREFVGLDRGKVFATLPGLRQLRHPARLPDWRFLLAPPAMCRSIPDAMDFDLDPPPRGMPDNAYARFRRIPAGEVLPLPLVGLVRTQDGEYVAGQITPMDGGRYRYLPRNTRDGLNGCDVARSDIIARIRREG